jgi:hypothetical protein
MLKGAFSGLDPDTDCIESVTAFEYVIPEGRTEPMKMGAALLLGARDGPPTMVTGAKEPSTWKSVQEPQAMFPILP